MNELILFVLLGAAAAACILAIRDRNEALLECWLLHSRIEALEKTKGLVIPKCEWSICARHNRAYWTEEGCLSCRIEELERAGQLAISEWSTWKDVLMSNMREADWQETMDGLRAPAALRSE